jgi:hypothetical protein
VINLCRAASAGGGKTAVSASAADSGHRLINRIDRAQVAALRRSTSTQWMSLRSQKQEHTTSEGWWILFHGQNGMDRTSLACCWVPIRANQTSESRSGRPCRAHVIQRQNCRLVEWRQSALDCSAIQPRTRKARRGHVLSARIFWWLVLLANPLPYRLRHIIIFSLAPSTLSLPSPKPSSILTLRA